VRSGRIGGNRDAGGDQVLPHQGFGDDYLRIVGDVAVSVATLCR
jgi:hypothetical protein